MSYSTPLSRALLYPPTVIAAVVACATEEGVATDALLRGSGLDPTSLETGRSLTSIEQLVSVCTNASRLSSNRSLASRVGTRLHLSGDGVYGLMLRSCASLPDYFRLSSRYRRLAPSTVRVTAVEADDRTWRLVVDDAHDGASLPTSRAFLVDMQAAREATRLADLLGVDCPPASMQASAGGDRVALTYAATLLDRRPACADAFALKTLLTVCDHLLAEIEASLGLAGQVYRTLRDLSDPGMGMKAVAARLRMTDRTLRRRLADEGTTYSTISHHVRYAATARQLHRSDASIEEIAAATGFSDPANFRRAFIRWTSMSPAQFRRRMPV